jgi:hypothetical protein
MAALAYSRATYSDAAVDFASRVARGDGLPTLPSPVPLAHGEVLHADLLAECWRYCPADVAYEAQRPVAIGGPVMVGLVAAAGAISRRRARRGAEAVAVAQWRRLGDLRILATSERLLVWHGSGWSSVWGCSIRAICPDLDAQWLDLLFDDDPPYRITGPGVPLLTVIVALVVARERGLAVPGVDAPAQING